MTVQRSVDAASAEAVARDGAAAQTVSEDAVDRSAAVHPPVAPALTGPGQAEISLTQPLLYFNRELSWLRFNERVLEEAEDTSNPLLERLKFLAIFSSNLDEFVMIRYAGLKEQVAAGIEVRAADGMTPREQIAAVSDEIHTLVRRHRGILTGQVLPALARHGVRVLRVDELEGEAAIAVRTFFEHELFPVLTPLAVDASHPFPRLPNLSFSLLLDVVDRETQSVRWAVVQVPSVLPRFLRLPGVGHDYVILEDVIRANVGALFPGNEVRRAHGFRVTRNADIEIAEDEADDLLHAIEDEVRRRRWGDAVRLELEASMPERVRVRLRKAVGVDPEDTYDIPHHLNASDFTELALLDIPALRFPPFVTRLPTEFRNHDSVFAAISEQDVLVHHPFHAFETVQMLVDEAADDPAVLAIKMTLYRVGLDSPVVDALARAAGNGKLVTALVELKARFDEENNIEWARELERAGVHVVYGFAGLKTHTKALLVVRREKNEAGQRFIRRYVHLGTGNYNSATAKVYTDLALLTCDPEFGADVTELFNYLTGYSSQREWRKLWVAPTALRAHLDAAIARTEATARAGEPARIIAKMNSIVDPDIIRALYRASQAGVEIDLIVRGICCLRPGVPGVSERIRVRSIVGRFLEHSRIFCFRNGEDEEVYLGSADWMQRNLNRRVETLFPIESARLRSKVVQILDLCLRDNVKARELGSDGTYVRVARKPGQNRLDSQARLLEDSARRLAQFG